MTRRSDVRRTFSAPSVLLLLAGAGTGCGLLGGSEPVEIPVPLPSPTLRPGDVVRVLQDLPGGPELAVLTVSEAGTVEVPGAGPMPVDGYTLEDLASVWLSVRPEEGAVRVERVPLPAGAPR